MYNMRTLFHPGWRSPPLRIPHQVSRAAVALLGSGPPTVSKLSYLQVSPGIRQHRNLCTTALASSSKRPASCHRYSGHSQQSSMAGSLVLSQVEEQLRRTQSTAGWRYPGWSASRRKTTPPERGICCARVLRSYRPRVGLARVVRLIRPHLSVSEPRKRVHCGPKR